MADGGIVQGGEMTMTSMQKTFSLALSRSLAPEARLVAYCLVNGNLITDSLTFYVTDSRIRQVHAYTYCYTH